MKPYEIKHEINLEGENRWYIYDNIANHYRGEYSDLIIAQEDCDLFNQVWEEEE